MQQRKVVDSSRVAEEGRATGLVYSSNFAESDLEPRKRQQPQQYQTLSPSRQGWNPVTVLLVGAVLVVSGVAWYANSQAAMHKLAYSQLLTSSHEKQVQVAKTMSSAKHQIEALELSIGKLKEDDKQCQLEVKRLHEDITDVKHSLHEEQIKSHRMHRDNIELHKKLKVKSSELKILETQTSQFEAEMSRLSKAIHTLQGEVQDDVDSGTIDYEILFKKQAEQRKRHNKQTTNGGSAAESGAADTTEAGFSGGKTYSKHHALKGLQDARLGGDSHSGSTGSTRSSAAGDATAEALKGTAIDNDDIMTATATVDPEEAGNEAEFATAAAASLHGVGGDRRHRA